MKRIPTLLWVSVAVFCFAALLNAALPQFTSGKWTPAENLATAREGASAVLLPDGRILITGGTDAAGQPLASAELLNIDGSLTAAAPMNAARSGHVAVMLYDGDVLVAGGTTTGGGVTNSAELYDLNADHWTTLSGTMLDARAGATAAQLLDGDVLIAGGQDAQGIPLASLERFVLSQGVFTHAGALATARKDAAAALLNDGRVLVTGGTDANGNSTLASTEIYDPAASSVSAGPALVTARAGHSATTLLDGTVLIAGGNNPEAAQNGAAAELASAELYDPAAGTVTATASLATARTGHQAFLLPNNNNVLIVGGSAAGIALASAELYAPWNKTFQTTAAMASARAGATGAALYNPSIKTGTDGLLLVAGGKNDTGTLASGELYGFATVKTDAADYPPGSTVTITGSGWQPGETVTLTLVESPLIDTHGPYTTVADAFGNISESSFVTDAYDENIRFYLTASGSQSQAQNTFTDSKPNTASLSPSSFTVLPGNTATYTVTVNFNGNNNSCTSPLSLAFTSPAPVGTTTGFSPNPLFSTGGDASSTLTITTRNTGPASGRTQPGTYPFTVTAGNGAGCQAGTATANGTLAVAGSATALSVTGYPSPTTAGTPQNFTVTAFDANGNTAIGYANTVHFTSSDSQAVLPANYTFVAADKGTHTFSATLKTAGTQSITATDTVTGTITGTQGGIAVSAAATARLLVANYPSPVTAGTSNSFTVTATDASGNLTAGYTGTVHFTSSDGAATLPANYTFTAGNGKDNGTHTFSATLNTAGAQSITATDTGTASINGTQPGITVNASTVATSLALAAPSPASVAFGSAGPVTFSATLTRTTGGAAVSGATVNFTVDGNAAGSATTSASGVATVSNYNPSAISVAGHDVQASFAGAAISGTTYSASTSGIQTLTVSTADQTINFGTLADKTYGDASFTVSATGGASGNAVTFTASPASVCTATGTNGSTITITGAGACTVTAHQAGNSNYNAAADVPQSLTVKKKDATWTTNANSKTYGDADPNPLTTGSGSGFLAADNVTATYTRATGETVLGGPYHITATLGPAAVLSNYNVTNTGANFTINRRDVTWSTSAASKTYGDADPTPLTTGSGNNFVAADNVTASYSRAAGETVLGGPYHITAALSPAAVLDNYNITNTGANFTINRRDATWTTNVGSKTYGDTDPTPLTTGSGNNFVAADNVTASYSRAAGESVLGGPYHITAALSPASVLDNYNITNTGANFTINRRDATWSTNASSKTYGDVDPSPLTAGSGNNFVPADNVTASYSRAAGETVLGGPYHITATLGPAAVLSNYNVTNTGANFTINRRDVTWSTSANSKTYGDADPTPLTTGSGNNFVAADNVTASYSRAAGETVLGGPYHITAALSPAAVLDNYNVTNTGANFTINRRDATWSTSANSKTYGDADPTPLTTGSGNNLVAADNVTATYTRATGETVVGGPYHITAALSPAAVLSNYNVTNTGANFTINRRDATWTTNASSKTYGDLDPSPLTAGSGSNFVAADNVTATYARATGETVVGGPYHITAALSPSGVLANYNITNAGANFTINRRDVTWSTSAASKTYGDADPTPLTTGSGNNFVAADNVTASYSRAAGETVVGGPYHITAALSPAAVLDNYNVTNTGANFTINRRDATWTTNPASKTYGDADPSPLTTGSGNNFVAADNVTATYTRATGETVLGGPYHITATLGPAAVLSNYNITNTGANFSINRRDATWSTSANSKTYGDADPTPLTTGSGNNFVAADNVTASYSRAAGETVLGGPYHITATLGSAAVLSNYNVTNTGANFTINRRDATWSTSANSKTYGDADPTPLTAGSGSNFVAADNVTASYTRATGETVVGGPYHITAALSPSGVLDNYNITNTGANFTINRRDATWTTNASSKTYGDLDPSPLTAGSGSNFVAADNVTATYARATGETVLGGPYHITAALSPAAVLENYNVTNAGASFAINKRDASVTPNAASKTYGDSDPALTGALTNFVASDGVIATYSRTVGETVAGSPYSISATLSPTAVLGNYNITYNTADFTIGKRNASVTPNAASKTYGDSDPALSGALTNFVASDGVIAAYSRTVGETVAGSPYSVSATLSPAAVLGNYNITYNTAAFTIGRRNASVTPNAAGKTYGNSDPALTGTLTNFVVSDGVTAAYSRTAGETVASSPYTISAALSPAAVLGNYNLTYNTAAFTISKATLTVKADDKTMVLHDALPPFTATYTGFKFSDTFASAVTGSPSLTTTASPASAVGTYTVVAAVGTLAANNYTFAFVNGTLNILYSTDACLGDLGHAVLQPINATGTTSVFKLGSTVPTKFRVCDANGVSIGTPGVVTGYGLVAAVNSPSITVDEDVYSTTPDTAFRWAGDQWIFNQSTKNNGTLNKTNTTYYFGIHLNDGSWIYFQYGLK